MIARPTRLIALCLALLLPWDATAANTPCSGSKGGIDHCQGDTFVCKDGSVSASKKSCSATMGPRGLLDGAPTMAPAGTSDCDCRSGLYCTGPARRTLLPSGRRQQSYLRQ